MKEKIILGKSISYLDNEFERMSHRRPDHASHIV